MTMKQLILLSFLLAACGNDNPSAIAAPATVQSVVDKGLCTGAPIKECAGTTLRGCAYKAIYSDPDSLELWTTFDGTKQYRGYCAYGTTANSCAPGTTCP